MKTKIKHIIKKILASLGLFHPSLGIKISSEAKAIAILRQKSPEIKILVETGTFKGDMIERLKNHFQRIYSIELNGDLYRKATQRFRGDDSIKLLHGDSGAEIQKVLEEIDEPALFWLDAHASGDITINGPTAAPVEKELMAILAHPVKDHSILIDDARKFDLISIKMLKKLAETNNYSFSTEEGLFKLKGGSNLG